MKRFMGAELEMVKALEKAQSTMGKTQLADKSTRLGFIKPGLRGGAPPMFPMGNYGSDSKIRTEGSVESARAFLMNEAKALEERLAQLMHLPRSTSKDVSSEKSKGSFPTTEGSTASPSSKAALSPLIPPLNTLPEFKEETTSPVVHQSRPRERRSHEASEEKLGKDMSDVIQKIKMMEAEEGNSKTADPAQQQELVDEWLKRNRSGTMINWGGEDRSYVSSHQDPHRLWGYRRSISEVRDPREVEMLIEKGCLLKRLREINVSLRSRHLKEFGGPIIAEEAELQAQLAEEANLKQQWEDFQHKYQRYPLRKEERDSPKLKRSSSVKPSARRGDLGDQEIQLEVTSDTLREEYKKFAQQQSLQEQALREQIPQQQTPEEALQKQVLQEQAPPEQTHQQQTLEQQALQEQIRQQQALQEQIRQQQALEEQARQQEALQEQALQEKTRQQQLLKQQALEKQRLQQQVLQEQIRQQQALEEQVRQQEALQEQARQEKIRQQTLEQQALQEQIRQQEALQEQIRQQQALEEQARQQEALQEQARQEKIRQQTLEQQALQEQIRQQQALQEQIRQQQALEEQARLQEALLEKTRQQQLLKQQALQEQTRQQHIQQQAPEQQTRQQEAIQQVLQEQANQRQAPQPQNTKAGTQALKQEAPQQQVLKQEAPQQQTDLPPDLQSICNLLRKELLTLVIDEIPKQVSQIAQVEIQKFTTGLSQNLSPQTRDSGIESTDGMQSSVSTKVHATTQVISMSDMASMGEGRNVSAQGDWDYNIEAKKREAVTRRGYAGDMGADDQMADDYIESRKAQGAIPKRGTRHRIPPSIPSDTSPHRIDSKLTLKSAESYVSKVSDDIFESTVDFTTEEEKSEIGTIFEDCTTTSVTGDYSSSPSPKATVRSETEDDSKEEEPLKPKQRHHKRESHHKKRTPSPSESSFSELLVRPKTPPKLKHDTHRERHARKSSHDPKKHSVDTADAKTKKEKSKRHSEKVKHHKDWSSAESTVEPKKDTSKPQKLRHTRKVSSEEHKDLSPRSDTIDTEDLQKSPRKESKRGSPKSRKEQVSHHRKWLTYGDPMDVSLVSNTEDIVESSYMESKKSDSRKPSSTQISPKRGQIWTHTRPYPREQEKVQKNQEWVISQVEPTSKITTPLHSAVPSMIREESPSEEETERELNYQYIEQPLEIWDEHLKKWKVIPRGQIRTREPAVVSASPRNDPKVSPQISCKSPQGRQVQLQQTQHKRGLQKVTQEPMHIRTSGSPLRQHFAEPSTSAKHQGKKGLQVVLQKPIEIESAPSPGYMEEGTSDISTPDTVEAKKQKEIAVEVGRDPRLTHAYMYKGGSPDLSATSVPEKDPKVEEYYLKKIDKLPAEVAKTCRMILKLNPQLSAKDIFNLMAGKKISSGTQLIKFITRVFPPNINIESLRLIHNLLTAPKEQALKTETAIRKQQQSFHQKVVKKLEADEASGSTQKTEKTHEHYVQQLVPPHLTALSYGGDDDQQNVVLWKPKKKKKGQSSPDEEPFKRK